MAVSDYILYPAIGHAAADSAKQNSNNNDLEDTSIATFGMGVISGGVCTIGTGLSVNVDPDGGETVSQYLLGIVLSKSAEVVAILANKTNAILWVVTDPDVADRCYYQWIYDGSILPRATPICRATSGASTVTVVSMTWGDRVSFREYSLLISQVDKALQYDINAWISPAPTSSQVLLRFVAIRSFTFPASMTGSRGSAGTASTASTVFSFKKNGTQFATATFAIAGTIPTWVAATATSFVAGDVLTIVAPASADATLAAIAFGLLATLD